MSQPFFRASGRCSHVSRANFSESVSSMDIQTSKEDQRTCQYCGSTASIVREERKVIQRWLKRTSVRDIRFPVCGRCWTLIKNRKLPSTITLDDSDALSILRNCKIAAHNLSKSSKMESVMDLLGSITEASRVYDLACADFENKAREAWQASKRVEHIKEAVEAAKGIVFEKLQITYTTCRQVANRFIGNPELRYKVFERDGFACKNCGETGCLTVDHIVPVKLGGSNELGNLQTLCLFCNSSKGARV